MVHFINLYWLKPITKYFSVTSNHLEYTRSSRPEVFCKKVVLRNFAKFTGKQLCQRPQAYIFIKKETLAQVFSCEFCKISKNTFLCRTPLVAASDMLLWEHLFYVLLSCLIKILTCASNK